MKRSIYFFALTFLPLAVLAQNPLWMEADTVSRSGTTTINRYTQDKNGNHYYVGNFSGTVKFGSYSFRANNQDAFVLKLNANRKVEWAEHLTGPWQVTGVGLAVDTNENVFMTGSFFTSVKIDGKTVNSGGSTDGFLIKFEQDGSVDWYRTATGTSVQQPKAVTVDEDGAVYWVGDYLSSSTIAGKSLTTSGFSYDCFLAKVTSKGHTSWVKKFGGSSIDQTVDIDHDNNKSLVLTGNFFSSITFGSTTVTGSGSYDIFVASYDSAGKFSWAISAGGTGNDQATSVSWDGSNGMFLTGTYTGNASIAGKSLSGGFNDMFVSRLNKNVKATYAKKIEKSGFGFGQNIVKKMVSDGEGGALVLGSFSSDLSINTKTIKPAGGFDAFVLRVSQTGGFDWINTAGGTGADRGEGIVVDASGYYHVGGTFTSKADFGSIKLNGNGGSTIYYARGVEPITPPDFKGKKNVFLYADSAFSRSYDLKIKAETSYELVSGPNGLTFDSSTVTIAWTPTTNDFGKHTVKIRAENLAGVDTSNIVIWVLDQIKAQIVSHDTVCLGSDLEVTYSAPNAGPTTAIWWFSDGSEFLRESITHTFKDTGLYVMGARVSNVFSHTDTTWKTVYVTELPQVDFEFKDACLNDTLKLMDKSTAKGGISSYEWLEDGALVSTTSGVRLFKGSRDTLIYKLVATVSGGCKDSATKTIRITAKPEAKFAVFNTCQNEEALFFDQSTTDGDTIVSYSWDFGDGNSITVGYSGYVHKYTKSGKFIPSLKVTTSNNCSDITFNSLTVHPKPVPAFNLNDVCGNVAVALNDDSDPKGGTIIARIWDFGDGKFSSKKNTTHTYATAGEYTISLTVTNSQGCSDTLEKNLVVNPEPRPDMDIGNTCANALAELTGTVKIGNSDSLTSSRWFVDDVSVGDGLREFHNFSDPTKNYTVKLVIATKGGCTDSVQDVISPQYYAPSEFTIPKACIGDTVDVATNFGDSLDSVFWVPLGLQMFEHHGGWKAVLLSEVDHHLFSRTFASNGCQDSSFAFVETFPQPNSEFTFDPVGGKKILFTPQDLLEEDYEWSFGDGGSSTLSQVTHEYDDYGEYIVKLTVTNDDGCSYSTDRTINVDFPVSDQWFDKSTIQLYPNPTRAKIFVDLPSNENLISVTFFDVNGRVVLDHRLPFESEIDVSVLPTGIYRTRVQTEFRSFETTMVKH